MYGTYAHDQSPYMYSFGSSKMYPGRVVQLQPGSYVSCLVEWYLVRARLRTSTLPFRAKMIPWNLDIFFAAEQFAKSVCRAQVYCFRVLSISFEPFVPSHFLHPSKNQINNIHQSPVIHSSFRTFSTQYSQAQNDPRRQHVDDMSSQASRPGPVCAASSQAACAYLLRRPILP